MKRARECTPGEFDEAGIFHIKGCTEDGCWEIVKRCNQNNERVSYDPYNTQYGGWICEKRNQSNLPIVLLLVIGFVSFVLIFLFFLEGYRKGSREDEYRKRRK